MKAEMLHKMSKYIWSAKGPKVNLLQQNSDDKVMHSFHIIFQSSS